MFNGQSLLNLHDTLCTVQMKISYLLKLLSLPSRAVSELAEALRDSDDAKKQRNEAVKENKEFR